MTTFTSQSPQRVVIAGGGVAGLEALFALHALARDRVELTLVAPRADFVYRPLAVAEPFSVGRARHTPLADAVRDAGARHVAAAVESVDPETKVLHTSAGPIEYDALILAVGAQSTPAYARALTWDDRSEPDQLGGLLLDIEQGYTKRLAVVIPPGPGWPLPAYELALLIARQARGMCVDLQTTLVTPEHAPLAAFGPRAVEAVSAELEAAGVAIETSAYADVMAGHATTVVMRPSDRRLEVDRVVALPHLGGRRVGGVPADPDGFVEVDEHCRVRGMADVWAAGDGIAFPIKFGGLAAEQADAAAEDIAARAGAAVEPRPFRPVLRGRLLTGPAHSDQWMRYDAAGGGGEGETATQALWWPPSKVAGRYLSPWLAARDDEAVAGHLPRSGGVPVQTDLHREFAAS
ncbi:MAG: sulfide:quinone oxidoreductase [Solirubrobacteraceae bacterium]|jgi:sulfide:quinone oxidoreductase|nr:sulfide:quinone oxidoreductase [Solirubrobacteraceae bacterium]